MKLYIIALLAVVVSATLAAVTVPRKVIKASSTSSASSTCTIADVDKVDCGSQSTTQSDCQASNCCWAPAGANSVTPWCYRSVESNEGYKLNALVETDTGYEGYLSFLGDTTSSSIPDIQKLKLDIIYESEDIIRVKVTDATAVRWEVPQTVVERPIATSKPASTNYEFVYTESPFTFQVIRLLDNMVIFSMDKSFVYKDQLIELETSIDTTATTYGLGESSRLNQALNNDIYTLWAADIPAAIMDVNLYGAYPYYIQVVNGLAHGAMLMNSNAMDITLTDTALTFKSLGGIIDLYVFTGTKPNDVVSQYSSIVGRPAMMPYWSLGFHNCRYGYTSLQQVIDVVGNYSQAGIPLDTQWMDIDYMQSYRDFTTDSANFPTAGVASFVDTLHANGQHFVPIVDPGIMIKEGYDAYDTGMKEGVFIKDITGGYYLGQVWPGPTYFPDFLNPKTQSYWTSQIETFYNMVSIDGLWIDMNEVSNFCNLDGTGQYCENTQGDACPNLNQQTSCCLSCKTIDSSNQYDFPPYLTGNFLGKLGTKTMALSSTHYDGTKVYNTHNLYGLTEQIATNNALKEVRSKRPFVLSRSSFMGSGKHSAKWTGDNASTWNDLKASIIGVADMNLFAVIMAGADICGFLDNTTEELCARWIEVGAFTPFSRNHNALGQADQELYLWDSVAEASRNALGMRYQLLPYMYTQMYRAATEGITVMKGLWVNFPYDAVTLTINEQFMIGAGIMISPALTEGSTTVNAYFSQGLWYDFKELTLAVDASVEGVYKSLYTPLTSVNVHIIGGNTIPLQQAALTTTAGRLTPFNLVIAHCEMGQSEGMLFWDDGEQIDIDSYLLVKYTSAYADGSGAMSSTIVSNSYPDAATVKLQTITILARGLTAPTVVTLNGAQLPSSKVTYDTSKGNLVLSALGLSINQAITLTWA